MKRGFKPEIDRIKAVIETHFSTPVTQEEDKLITSYKALTDLKVWIADKKLYVETISNPDASDEDILQTNSKFRKFLDDATGYTSKQRVKMAKEKANK